MSQIKLTGIPVSKIYYQGQNYAISNGLFTILNDSNTRVKATDLFVSYLVNGIEHPIKNYYVYQLPGYTDISGNIDLAPHSEINVDVSFSFVYIKLRKNDKIQVKLTCKLNNVIYAAISDIYFKIRVS